MTLNGRGLSVEDNFRWKTIINGRRPLMENDIQSVTSFDEGRPSMEEWRTIFHQIKTLIEDNIHWKSTKLEFDTEQPIFC